MLAIVGDQFGEAGEDLCGAVLSIRGNEDVLSVWTRVDGSSCLKIKFVPFLASLPCHIPHAQETELESQEVEAGD